MIKVAIIGSGKLAQNLLRACCLNKFEVTALWARNTKKAEELAHNFKVPLAGSLQAASVQTDIVFLAISDNAIEELAAIINTQAIVVHCSGILPASILKTNANYGVFWPIQTFSETRTLDFNEIPIAIEASDEENKRILEVVADTLGQKAIMVNEGQRQHLHLAAVFVNNFSNHLFSLMHDFLGKNHLDFKYLLPLISETAEKLKVLSPAEAQTGPASRGDENSMEIHRKILVNEPKLLEIYDLISKSIATK
jgi:predicted short-subunit dehydrogenase-like oxidoreductase (DUF2520 family)